MIIPKTWFLTGGLITLLAIVSCSKEQGVCFSNTGNIVTQKRYVPDFDSIRVTDHVNIILKQDSVNGVMVEAGENIISGITTVVSGRELLIGNSNHCNWLRSYDKPLNVYLSVKNLMKIYYESSGNIISEDTIRSGNLKIDLWGGCGTIDLKVHLDQGNVIQHLGTATVLLSGVCGSSSVFSGNYGLIKLDRLKTRYSYVTCSGSNDCYIRVSYHLEATITSIGNIYFAGDPWEIKEKITGEGRLIPY